MDYRSAGDYALNRLKHESLRAYTYHNLAHTLDVHAAAERLSHLEGLTTHETMIVGTAAYFHELGIPGGYPGHEERAVDIAIEVLPSFGYSESEIGSVCRLIKASNIEIKPCNLAEEIICDADLDYLGREDYWRVSDLLRQEWSNLGHAMYSDLEWYMLQLDFLTRHHFFTNTAQSMRNEQKILNISRIQDRLNDLKNNCDNRLTNT